MKKKNVMWVEVKVMNVEQSLEIIKFLCEIARNPRKFKSDDLVAFNPKLLCFKSSLRFLRDLRQQGLINYEVANQRQGIYELHSNYTEVLRAKAYIEQGGYWIDDKTTVLIGEKCGVPVTQISLLN